MTYIVDIDDTIIKSDIKKCTHCGRISYESFKALQKEIDELNKRYNEGDTIILYTGRGWDQYEITKEQLKKCRIKYSQLLMGKPIGIWVDKDSVKSVTEHIKN